MASLDDKLLEDWKKLQLTEEETKVLGGDFEDVNDESMKAQVSLSLIGKILTGRPFNFEALKRTLTSIWRLREGVAVRTVDTNLFMFQFFCEEDKERVLGGRPWSFDHQIFLLQELKGDEQPSEVVFSHSPF